MLPYLLLFHLPLFIICFVAKSSFLISLPSVLLGFPSLFCDSLYFYNYVLFILRFSYFLFVLFTCFPWLSLLIFVVPWFVTGLFSFIVLFVLPFPFPIHFSFALCSFVFLYFISLWLNSFAICYLFIYYVFIFSFHISCQLFFLFV